MGKRTHTESSDYESIKKKFKKLERQLLRARRKDRDRVKPPSPKRSRLSSSASSSSGSSSSSSSSSTSSSHASPPPSGWSQYGDLPAIEYEPRPSTSRAAHVPPPLRRSRPDDPDLPRAAAAVPPPPAAAASSSPATAAPPPPAAAPPSPPRPHIAPSPPPSPLRNVQLAAPLVDVDEVPPPANTSADPALMTPQLNDELMQLLGEDPSQKKVYGKDIQPDLAVRLEHLATAGLSKEIRKELLDKYLPPANCTLIDAPTLNPEVKAAVSEATYKRDKGIEAKQRQIASAITAVAEALTLVLSCEQPNTELIKILMDVQKLLCDSQNSDSIVRRNFVLFNLKKELKDQLQTTKIDKFLFSEGLAETLKAAKAITKSGAEMKLAPPKQQPPKKANKQFKSNLNWRAAPQSHRSKGTQKNKEPAYKSLHETSSRSSSRPAPQPQKRSRR